MYLRVDLILAARHQIISSALIFHVHSDMRETNEIKLLLMDHERLIYGRVSPSQTPEPVQRRIYAWAVSKGIMGNIPGFKLFQREEILKKKSPLVNKRGNRRLWPWVKFKGLAASFSFFHSLITFKGGFLLFIFSFQHHSCRELSLILFVSWSESTRNKTNSGVPQLPRPCCPRGRTHLKEEMHQLTMFLKRVQSMKKKNWRWNLVRVYMYVCVSLCRCVSARAAVRTLFPASWTSYLDANKFSR